MASTLSLLIANEYKSDLRSKAFWISTILFPVLMIGLGAFGAVLADDSETFREFSSTTTNMEGMSPKQLLGMVSGMFLVIFIMLYGVQIFNKVKVEKTNRIVEVLVSSVPGRTLMIAKVISVALIGLTQIIIWVALLLGAASVFLSVLATDIPFSLLFSGRVLGIILVGILFFCGGFLFYGSLLAACGAMTDRNNENQGYVSFITMVLMISMYVGMFSIDNAGSLFAQICFYVPFTSPAVGCVLSIGGSITWWETILSIVVLYGCAILATILAGKIYTSSVLLKGKKFNFNDIITFIKAK